MFIRVLCVCVLWLSAAAAQAADFRITFISPGFDHGFWGDVSRTMEAAARDLNADLEIFHSEAKPYRMEEILQERLLAGNLPDYFILVNSEQSGARMMQLLDGKPSKVLFLIDKLSATQKGMLERRNIDLKNVVASIVPDNEIAGYEIAVSLFKAARARNPEGATIRLLALTGDSNTPASAERDLGMLRAVADNPDVELVHALPANWSAQLGYQRTQEVLRRSKIDAVWAANDLMSLGAQRAAADAGFEPGRSIVFSGMDWSQAGMEAVRDGRMTMTYGGHFFAGAWAVVMLKDHHSRGFDGEMFVDVLFKMSPVTPENVGLYLERFGDRNWDRIDFSKFCKVDGWRSHYDFSSKSILEAVDS